MIAEESLQTARRETLHASFAPRAGMATSSALLGFASVGLFPRNLGRLSSKHVLDLKVSDFVQDLR
eukprot:4020010-Amphidinium_carterae.1